jgi:hypothetical protein
MRIHFIYKECTNLFDPGNNYRTHVKPRNIFFVTASTEEVDKFLRHLMNRSQIEIYEKWNGILDQEDGQRCAFDNSSCFVISENLDTVCPALRVFPISAMWGTDHPFEVFKAEINNLDNLNQLNSDKNLSDWLIYGYGLKD